MTYPAPVRQLLLQIAEAQTVYLTLNEGYAAEYPKWIEVSKRYARELVKDAAKGNIELRAEIAGGDCFVLPSDDT